MFRRRERMIEIKSAAQVEKMRAAGLVVGQTLATLREAVAPGVTTAELDAIAESAIRGAGAIPSFKGYQGFPASICASVNDEIVHGIPADRALREGDIISIDCGAILDGWHGDAAITVPVGVVSAEKLEIMRVCEEAMWRGIAAARLDGRLTDISHAVETYIRSQGGYGIVEEYVGHGIGTEMHQEPQLPNYGPPGRGPKLREGLVLAVEPMVNLGGKQTVLLDDGWTVRTADASPSAHFEHTFTLTPAGPRVLTSLDEGKAKLAELAATG